MNDFNDPKFHREMDMAKQVNDDLARESLRDHKGVAWDRYQAVCDELEAAYYKIEELEWQIETLT